MRVSLLVAAVCMALPVFGRDTETAAGNKKLKSGLQPGQGVGAFPVVDVTGRFNKKSSVCYNVSSLQ